MVKKVLRRNSALILLTLTNIAIAVRKGFDWLTALALILTGVVLILDIKEAMKK